MSRSIVIVDDNPDVRETLELVLSTLEIPIIQAEDGSAALRIIKEAAPLLIVLDLEMPNLDGKAVCRALRSEPSLQNIPILIFTAYQVTAQLADELQIAQEFLLQKGRVSMTHLRNKVISIVGNAIAVDLFLLK